jgi:hypothetical protein
MPAHRVFMEVPRREALMARPIQRPHFLTAIDRNPPARGLADPAVQSWPLEVGSQVQAPNRCKLWSSRVTMVSVAEKPRLDFGRYDPERRARANRR